MKKIYIVFIAFIAVCELCFAQGTWTQKANFPGQVRSVPFTFVIGNKGYVGCGRDYPTYLKDFWEYDPSTNVWTQKADYGGVGRFLCVGFSVLNKGYAGLGEDATFGPVYDFWEYDPSTNTWVQKSSYPGNGPMYPVSFSIGNFGYVATGNLNWSTYSNELWRYDPVSDLWIQKASLPGAGRSDASGFSIGNKGYVGVGYPGGLNDFWEYDTLTDSWTQKANFPATPRLDAAAFSICNKGYIGTSDGGNNDFWQYDPLSNTWTQKASFAGAGRDETAFFSIGNKGYIGLGYEPTHYLDFYEYTPDSTCSQCALAANFISSDTAFCSETGQCISFTELSSPCATSWHWLFPGASPDTSDQQNPTNICYSNPGTYPVTLIVANSSGSDTLAVTPLIIFANLPPPPTINVIGNDTLISSHGSSYQWYLNGSPIGGATDSFYIALQGGTYSVQITDSLGCNSLSGGVLITGVPNAEYLVTSIKLYPNPVKDELIIDDRQLTMGNNQLSTPRYQLSIYNVLGDNLYSQELQLPTSKSQSINCKEFPSGIYYVRLISERNSYIAKFVKE